MSRVWQPSGRPWAALCLDGWLRYVCPPGHDLALRPARRDTSPGRGVFSSSSILKMIVSTFPLPAVLRHWRITGVRFRCLEVRVRAMSHWSGQRYARPTRSWVWIPRA